jgi:hypothetical protein
VPRDGLQESRFIKGLARGGTLKPLPVFFSFPYYGVPPIREEFRALPDDKRMRVARVLEVDAARVGKNPICRRHWRKLVSSTAIRLKSLPSTDIDSDERLSRGHARVR